MTEHIHNKGGADVSVSRPYNAGLEGASGEPASLTFVVPGIPVAKGRARTAKGHHFTPRKTVVAESTVAIFAAEAMAGQPLMTGPLRLTIFFEFPWPKSATKKRRLNPWKDTRPDLDNLAKTICDACNGVVWHDDGQVSQECSSKIYTDRPQTWIRVERVVWYPERPAG